MHRPTYTHVRTYIVLESCFVPSPRFLAMDSRRRLVLPRRRIATDILFYIHRNERHKEPHFLPNNEVHPNLGFT